MPDRKLVMGVKYGTKAVRVKSSDINLVVNTNGTILSQGDDSSGGYSISFQFNNAGCGWDPLASAMQVQLKDNVPWTKVSYEVFNAGDAACWNFNSGGTYGLGNLINFDSSLDRLFFSNNSFELSKYTKIMQACDNATTNFFHPAFKTGTTNSFFVTRRRNTSVSSLVNLIFERQCNSFGTGSYVTLRNIFVW